MHVNTNLTLCDNEEAFPIAVSRNDTNIELSLMLRASWAQNGTVLQCYTEEAGRVPNSSASIAIIVVCEYLLYKNEVFGDYGYSFFLQ